MQRYLDTSFYGIDFLRGGRKILVRDKTLFSFVDPDTGREDREYPIEMPANRGRLVGEIHIDHVGVVYQKNDFERGTRAWITVVDELRGDEPMKPKRGRENDKPLAKLYSAFRRNDPGTRYLTPGNGTKATHDLALQWGQAFQDGQAAYQTDNVWWQSVIEHQRAIDGDTTGPTASPPDTIEGILGIPANGIEGVAPAGVQPPPQTTADRFARLRAVGRPLEDCSGLFTVEGKNWNLHVIAVSEDVSDNVSSVPTTVNMPQGNLIEVFCDERHPIFSEAASPMREWAIYSAAHWIAASSGKQAVAHSIAAEILLNLPDQRMTQAMARDRAENALERIREVLSDLELAAVTQLWEALPQEHKEATHQLALLSKGSIDWPEAVEDGSYVAYIPARSLAAGVRHRPDLFFDGAVFHQAWKDYPDPQGKAAVADRMARKIEDIGDYLDHINFRGTDDQKSALLASDLIIASIVDAQN